MGFLMLVDLGVADKPQATQNQQDRIDPPCRSREDVDATGTKHAVDFRNHGHEPGLLDMFQHREHRHHVEVIVGKGNRRLTVEVPLNQDDGTPGPIIFLYIVHELVDPALGFRLTRTRGTLAIHAQGNS